MAGDGKKPRSGRPATKKPVAERSASRLDAENRGRIASEPEGGGTIVPPRSVAGRALVSVVAIMCFLACLAMVALIQIRSAAHDWQLDVGREVTIQVKPIGDVGVEMRLARALALARETRGVASARLVDEKESAALLEPWLGGGLDLKSLPVPRLVVVELADPATADLAGLRTRLTEAVEGASLDDHAVWTSRLRTMAGATVLVGLVVVVLVMIAMTLSIVFATRAAIAGNRDVLEVLHFVGAEDGFIAREFRRHFVALGFEGGILGGSASLALFLVAGLFVSGGRGDPVGDQAQALIGGFSIGWSGLSAVALVVATVTVLTGLTSHRTVLGHLRRLE